MSPGVRGGEQQDAAPSHAPRPALVVGLGASAGGLEALRALFGGLKCVERLAFVVVQHLAPQHRSRLVELIAHETALPVHEAQDGQTLAAGSIYVTPPNKDVVFEDGRLRLRSPSPKIGPKPSVDLFLASLAEALGDQAVGIILSGTGSDGSHGVRAIKAAGGLTLCQSIESAKYDGMPRAALQTGAVDVALSPERLAEELIRIDRHDGPQIEKLRDGGAEDDAVDPFRRILALLDLQAGADLTDYKQSTIRRRIERRMAATGSVTAAEYAELLERSDDEVQALFGDILISVTSFFRDTEAFKALQDEIGRRVAGKFDGTGFRCWVAGCASGEEAYSISILVHEAMERLGKRLKVQIFATDLDGQALLIARKARYSKASLVEIPEALVERYFTPVEDRLEIIPEIRETVIFARHNLVSDPPFLGLDLVSCRNVLIYFNSRLQERVLRIFHYSLHPDGLLFLGRSEAAGNEDGFEPLDKHNKLYLRGRDSRSRELPAPRNRRELQREAELTARDRAESRGMDLYQSLVSAVAPDSVLVDEERRIRQVFGAAGDFLRLPTGAATMTLSRLLPAHLATELNTLLHRAGKSGRAVRGQRHEVELPRRGKVDLQLQAIPLGMVNRREYLVGFEYFDSRTPPPAQAPEDQDGADRVRVLEQEVSQLREHLQHTAEEYETANEELQALNEELQSTNEELQSSNEELETTNEELQSTNEELTTLNQELNVKSAELNSLNQRLSAIQVAISYPLLIVDRNLCLQDFNPASRYLFRISDGDLGASLRTVPASLDIAEVVELLRGSFEQERDQTLEMSCQGRYFEVRVQLFRDSRSRVNGAVVSFVEVTELRQALEEARLKERQISAITENTPALITMKDAQGAFTYVNSRFCAVTGLAAYQVLGRTEEELFGAAQGELIRERDFEVLKTRRPFQAEEERELRDGKHWWLSSRFPLLDEQNRAYSLCTVSLDITERVKYERELAVFRQVLSDATDGIVILRDQQGAGEYRTIYSSGPLLNGLGLRSHASDGTPLVEVLERLFAEAVDPDPPQLRRRLLEQPVTIGIHQMRAGSNDESWLQLRSTQLKPGVGQTHDQHLVLVVDDITTHVRNERALQEQKERLSRFSRFAALGEVAAGLSHEISTPLNAITTKTEILRRMVESARVDEKRMGKATRDIDRMVENIDQVIRGLKSLSRLSAGGEREQVNLRKLLEDTLRIVGLTRRRRGVAIALELPEEDLQLTCNPVQIAQILVNLLNNALDAVLDHPNPWIRVQVRQQGEQVLIEVIDSGAGIPREIAERVMTPFFTTKGDRGTGLGLSLSRNIARRHGGELELCDQAPNTTFRLRLPKVCAEQVVEEESA